MRMRLFDQGIKMLPFAPGTTKEIIDRSDFPWEIAREKDCNFYLQIPIPISEFIGNELGGFGMGLTSGPHRVWYNYDSIDHEASSLFDSTTYDDITLLLAAEYLMSVVNCAGLLYEFY